MLIGDAVDFVSVLVFNGKVGTNQAKPQLLKPVKSATTNLVRGFFYQVTRLFSPTTK